MRPGGENASGGMEKLTVGGGQWEKGEGMGCKAAKVRRNGAYWTQ